MICKYCGAELEEDALFCEECGNKIEKMQPDSLPVSGNENMPRQDKSAGNQKKSLPVIIALILAGAVVLAVAVCLIISLAGGGKKNKDQQEAGLKEAQVVQTESEYEREGTTAQNPDADLDAVAGTRFELNGYCAQDYNGNLYLTVEDAYSVNAADSFGTAHYYDDVREFLLTSDDSEILDKLGEHQVTASGTLYAIDEECVGFKVDNIEILDSGARTELDYCDNDTITYPASPADFTQVTSPDGAYTLMYPKSVFAEGYYDEDTESYYFSSADGSLTWSVGKQEAPIKNNPVSCANYMMNSVSSLFAAGDGTPYTHESSTVSESGFSRAIIGGQIKSDPGKGKYILYACSNENAFVFEFTFPYGGTSGITIDYTECGYMLDCMYRGWSISGSTRELRSFDQYMNDDMGAKKED
ncbi:MAG: zinc ribbon domain-containing protein [Lachnospiraceae bacterium]|nr:zinc ribbon domain-containing protein [Lachnospiraceae bacterium]